MSARLSQALLEQALSLIGRAAHGSPDDAARAAQELAVWRTLAPTHEAAYALAHRWWTQSDASALREHIGVPPKSDAAARQRRRQTLAWLGVGGLTAVFGGAARWHWLQPTYSVALRTGRGEVRTQTLPDGSTLTLAPNSHVQATWYRHRRDVRLAQGTLMLDVQPDAARPLHVDTAWGRVRVLGTAFTVAVRENGMDVAVARGRVAVWADVPGKTIDTDRAPDVTLTAGQSVATSVLGAQAPQPVNPQSVGAWREGWLVFQATPLPQAIDRWNDFLTQPIRLATADGERLRGLRLTGTFPASDPDGFLQGLPAMLPVRVQRKDGQPVVAALR